ncbi:flagellin lysine-N-methylase [Trinickia mobilis]|uniref:flagellin lysine-N-methylase n=1 Tax=Trinickia mobilis TaxID=2816356 RepID=UPI001A8EB8FB|nr:flagellin lysine-N-methylase [Trinickia mobilis]
MKQTLVTHTMIVPRYVTRFACVGPQCPASCCAGWRVTVDKPAFLRYKATPDPDLAPRFKIFLQRNRHARGAHDYGTLKQHDDDGRCGMQDASGLCQVQMKLGEEALSNTCHAYPRTTQRFAGQYEQVLTLSCPEAARLALLRDDAFDFEAHALPARAATLADKSFGALSDNALFAARAWTMQLLRVKELDLADRLAVLGLLCDQLETLMREQRLGQVPVLLDQLTALVQSGDILSGLSGLPRNDRRQAELFAVMLCKWRPQQKRGRLAAVFERVAAGLGANEQGQAALDTIVERYRAGRALLDRTEHYDAILTRFLLNETIRDTFPWGSGSPLLQHRRWVVVFGIVRGMLAACANAVDRPLHDDEIVDGVWAFCRAFQHQSQFAQNVEQTLQQCHWDSLPRLLAVLK